MEHPSVLQKLGQLPLYQIRWPDGEKAAGCGNKLLVW
jgi:hypothetical protein